MADCGLDRTEGLAAPITNDEKLPAMLTSQTGKAYIIAPGHDQAIGPLWKITTSSINLS